MLNDDMNTYYSETGPTIRSGFDSFGRLNVSQSSPLFDLKSIYGATDLRDKSTVTGSGTLINEKGYYELATGTTTGSSSTLDSAEKGRYIAGFECTPGLNVQVPVMPEGDEYIRWGYFNTDEGFGIGVDSEGLFTFIRKGGTERTHRQNEFQTKLPADFSESDFNIYQFPFRWYGSGPVKFEVSKVDNGLYPGMQRFDVFEALEGETLTENPNLPIRIEVSNGTGTRNLQARVCGRSFYVKGEYKPSFRITSEHRLAQSVGTTFVPLVAFQQKSTDNFDSISLRLNNVELASSGADVLWQVRIGANIGTTITGTPSNIPATETALLVNKAATSIIGGQKIQEGLVVAGTGAKSSLAAASLANIALPDNLNVVLCARSVSGTATVSSSFGLREEW